MKGRRVRTLRALNKLAIKRKAVVIPDSWRFRGHVPASFLMRMQAWCVLGFLRLGIYRYKKGGRQW